MSWFTEIGLFVFAALGNMILSGIATVIYQSQNEKMKSTLMLFLQTSVAGITFIIIALAMGDFKELFKIDPYPFLALVFAAIIGIVIGNFLYLISMRLIGVSKAYPISMTYLLMTYIMEILFLEGEFKWLMLLGIAFVTIGVILISLSKVNKKKVDTIENIDKETIIEPEILDTISEKDNTRIEQRESHLFLKLKKHANVIGVIFSLIAALTWASGTSLIKYGLNKTPDVDIIPINAARMIYLVPITLTAYLFTFKKPPKKNPGWKSYLFIGIAAILGLVGANILYLVAINSLGTSIPAAIAAAGPMIATPLSIIFLKEKVDWKIILGTTFTISGLVVISFII
ncbi:MAG: DMT family transporter [Candidatus Heimdallarchaeota archaeon]|nr:DMT family transporter [Candidatus Heimdallarchaeota archaeon]